MGLNEGVTAFTLDGAIESVTQAFQVFFETHMREIFEARETARGVAVISDSLKLLRTDSEVADRITTPDLIGLVLEILKTGSQCHEIIHGVVRRLFPQVIDRVDSVSALEIEENRLGTGRFIDRDDYAYISLTIKLKDDELRGASEVAKLKSTSQGSLQYKTLAENERQFILQTLEQFDWVIGGKKGAAEVLGVPVSTLRSIIKKLKINK